MDAERLAAIPPIMDECLVCDHIQAHIDALQAENERLQRAVVQRTIDVKRGIGQAAEVVARNAALQARVTLLEGLLVRAGRAMLNLEQMGYDYRTSDAPYEAEELRAEIDAALSRSDQNTE